MNLLETCKINHEGTGQIQVLVDDVMGTNKGHITTGIFGTKMIRNVLQDYDRNDVAFAIIPSEVKLCVIGK